MLNLYTLTQDFLALQSMMEEVEELDHEAIKNTMDGMSGDIDEVVDQSVKLVRNLEAGTEAVDAEIDRLTARKRRLEARTKSVRESIKALLIAAGRDKATTPLFTVTVAKGRESVRLIDESAVPDDYVTVQTTIKPDKKLIGEAFKSGQTVAGCEWVRGEPSLRIK